MSSCPTCGGTGYIKASEDDEEAVVVNDTAYKECPTCGGKGV
jgi:DnaJ-class molecular chaperone